MKSRVKISSPAPVIFTLLIVCSLPFARAGNPIGTGSIESAHALFKVGRFSDAETVYRQVATREPNNTTAFFRLGTIALLCNRLDDAQKWFEQVQRLRPGEPAVYVPLAEVFCRRDEFQRAVPLLRAAGQQAKAAQLASFKGLRPYDIAGQGGSTTLPFVSTDPLPLVQVQIDGSEPVNFFLDTGADEVILDTEFAHGLGVKSFGADEGTFAGGKQAQVARGKIDSLTLADWTVNNVPVEIMNTRRYAQLFGGKQIDGILGAELLAHFTATIDYPAAKLVLRRKAPQAFISGKARSLVSDTPFWLAGDHFLITWCQVDNLAPILLMVDTGSAGGAAKLTRSVLYQAGIDLSERGAMVGIGGGGNLNSIPFTLKQLSLGDAREQNVRGWCEEAFPWENSLGFRLGGLIGHDFLKPYAVTFDFVGMRIVLERSQSQPQ